MAYKKNIFNNLLNEIFKIFISFFSSVIVARGLGTDNFGKYTFIFLIFNLIGNYGHFGIINATSYFYKRKKYDKNEVIKTNSLYAFCNGIIIFGIFLILKFVGVFEEFSYLVIFNGFLFIFFSYISLIMRLIYISEENIIKSNKFIFTGNLISFILLFFTYISNKMTAEIVFFIKGFIVFIPVILMLKDTKLNFRIKFNGRLLIDELKYGIILYLAALFIFLNYRLDQFMIKIILNTAELGIYSIGVNLAELLFLIPNSITTALSGKLYNINENDYESQKKHVVITAKFAFYISLILSLIAIFLTPLISILYGQEYNRAMMIIIILVFGIVFATIGKVLYVYYITKGEPLIHLIITFVAFLTNFILNIFLIPKFGINGAALASTISYFIYGVVYLLVFKIKENISILKFFIIEKDEIKNIKNLISIKVSNLINKK